MKLRLLCKYVFHTIKKGKVNIMAGYIIDKDNIQKLFIERNITKKIGIRLNHLRRKIMTKEIYNGWTIVYNGFSHPDLIRKDMESYVNGLLIQLHGEKE